MRGTSREAGAGSDDARLGRRLFRFGVVADSHLEPESSDAAADPARAPRSNRRNRSVVEALNERALPFVVHLGDIVHPVPAMPSYGAAADLSRKLFGGLRCPVYMTPGNHDIGDKPSFWSPAAAVKEPWIELYRSNFGDQFLAFDHAGCHFVLMNSPMLNSGLPSERRQRAWLEADLRRHRGQRIFLFTHYPPFLVHPDEPSHYDNIDEPARSWLLGLVRDYRVQALFAGHVHNFFYNRLGRTDLYILPSTAFVRRDYSELFRIEAAPEFGRDDAGKVGYFLVDVHERGHVARFQRTGGRLGEPGEHAEQEQRLLASHPRLPGVHSVGVHLRHPWAEIVEMPHNGPVDEFRRKRARNDYSVEAFWDLGLRELRVPLSDLDDRATRERMRTLTGLGHRFTVFSAGTPQSRDIRLLTAHARWLAGWELILPMDDIPIVLPLLRRAKAKSGLRVSIAPLQSSAGSTATEAAGANFKHFVSHGFTTGDETRIRALFAHRGARRAIDGIVFRVSPDSDPWDEIGAIRALCRHLRVEGTATICLAPEAPSGTFCDDRAIATRVAKAALAGAAVDGVRVFLDTFVDIDRGYCVRHGLLDRRYNRRLAGHVLRNLNSVLAAVRPDLPFVRTQPTGSWEAYVGARGAVLVALLLNAGGRGEPGLDRLAVPADCRVDGHARLIDLATGAVTETRLRQHTGPEGLAVILAPAVAGSAPALLVAGSADSL